MKTRSLLVRFLAAFTLTLALTAGQLGAQVSTFNDATNDIAPGISTGGGTLDIVKMEVVDTETDVVMTMTVNGNITSTDWGNFMVGIANGKTNGSTTGNGWDRPINLNAGGGNGMTHWIGSWVNGGGGSQLWTYAPGAGGGTGGNWSQTSALAGYSFAGAAQSTITYTVSKASLGVTNGDTIIFDAYSSGSGGGDSAVDALSNPTNSITGWGGPYTSVAPTLTRSYTLANTALNTTQDITFSVDMNAQIALGEFDPAVDFVSVDWGAEFSSFEYLDDGDADGIYTGTATISAPANTPVAYRFTIEAETLIPETVSRSFLMPESPLTIATVFFNNIEGYRDVTFTVDMSEQITLGNFDPATQTVEVRGSFNNFSGGDTLTALGGGLYSTTLTIAGAADGQSEEYKFYIAGPDGLGYETGDNLTFNLAFNSDGALTPALVLTTTQFRAPVFRPVTFSVDMSYQISEGNFDPADGVVEVRGSFNEWAGTAMTAGENGVYSVTINVAGAEGATAQYKFWAGAAGTGDAGYESGDNRTLTLGAPGVEQVLPTVFFSNDSGQSRDITFSVDMSVQVAEGNFDPATGVVQLRGIGGFGEAEARELTREGETLVYSGTFSVPGDAGSSFAYKFWATGPGFEVIDPNDLFLNRTTVLGPSGVAETLPTVFFSNQTAPTPVRDVTFSVDMSVQIGLGNFNPAEGVVEVRGPFNDWAGTVLTAGENGIYSGTVSVSGNVGASEPYKFWATGLDFEVGDNRTFVLGEGGVTQVLPTVFFNNVTGQVRDVTFSVDMSVQIALGNFVPVDGVVEVRGSFNGFAGGDVLTAQGNGIYSGTFSIDGVEGDSVSYKFFAANAGTDPAEPGYEAGDDRTFLLGASGVPQTLPVVFFSNNSGQSRDITFSVDMSVQVTDGAFDPATGVVQLRGIDGFGEAEARELTREGETLVYSGTFAVPGEAGSEFGYKFWATGLDFEVIDPADPLVNRTITLGPSGEPEVLPTVFFSNQDTPTPTREVTFSVNMSVQIALTAFDPATGVVEVRGSFNGFGGGDVLTDEDGDQIYTGTFTIAGAEGATVPYKFWATGLDFETGSDRTFVLGADGVPQTLNTVFFNNDSGQVRDITFSVDMSAQAALGLFDPATGVVELRGLGSFDAADAKTLDREGETLVYSGTFPVEGEVGTDVSFKFYSAGLNYFAEADPANPGFENINQADPFENRQVTLGASGEPQTVEAFFSNQLFGLMGTATAPLPDSSFDPFTSSQGTPSFPQSVSVSGVGLTADIVVTAPTGFEVSSDGITYGSTANIAPVAGSVTSANLFVRVAAAATPGSISGRVILASDGSQSTSVSVSATVTPVGETFSNWSGGQPLTPALQVQYAIGGASGPNATDGVPSVTTVTADTLSITAMVRTNDPTLTVTGQALVNLAVGPWSTNNVTVTVVNPQPPNVPAGCQAQTFSTPRGTDGRKFLRLQTSLPAAP